MVQTASLLGMRQLCQHSFKRNRYISVIMLAFWGDNKAFNKQKICRLYNSVEDRDTPI